MRGIIFDLDDTLYPRHDYVDSGFGVVADYVADSWRRDRAQVLRTLRRAHRTGHDRREFQVLCEEQRLPLSLIPVLVRVHRGHTPAVMLDGVVLATLESLRAAGWRLAVLTNGDPDVQRRKVAALGLDAMVDAVICAEEHAPGGKPAAAAFHAVLAHLQVSASRAVIVGDDPVCDVAGGRALGLWTIRMTGHGPARRLVEDADAVVTSMSEVPAIVRGLVREETDAA